jgi:tRNA uridine 5-carboxymethylaminomethyl modification enzyme
VSGVRLVSGRVLRAPATVITTGTFLRAVMHTGEAQSQGGRIGEGTSSGISRDLEALGLLLGRLKTGTPPRLARDSIDWATLEEQLGDARPLPFSSRTERAHFPVLPQVSCHLTHTHAATHAIIRANIHRAPMYAGRIQGVGPRYCPSVEDKVVRFAERTSHQIFVEPEGLSTHEVYPNGISTSLPFEVQVEFVRSIAGFEKAHLTRPGYAIEYDFFDPRDLAPSLQTQALAGLYFAGQINGTTGYEEAAAQGLLAGINAALQVRGEEAWVPKRSEAYLGVLVDDLTTRGTREPYRMFTSRAEHRLLLREDNADLRLTPAGRALGLIDDERWAFFEAKQQLSDAEVARLGAARVKPAAVPAEWSARVLGAPLAREVSAFELLRRPEVSYQTLTQLTGGAPWEAAVGTDERLTGQVHAQVEVRAKYAGYIERAQEEIERARRHEELKLPGDLNYALMTGLSHEVRQKLTEVRPMTLGQAARVPGVTPAAVQILLVHLKKRHAAAPAQVA